MTLLWHVVLSHSVWLMPRSDCVFVLAGECGGILIGKYADLAKEVLQFCLQTLREIVRFAKGPKPGKTRCDWGITASVSRSKGESLSGNAFERQFQALSRISSSPSGDFQVLD